MMKVKMAAVAACLALGSVAACGNGATTEPGAPKTIAGVTIKADPDLSKKVPESLGGVLKIATAAPYPPFEYFDDDQKLIGLDIDLGDAVAAKLGLRSEWTNVSFDGVIPGIKANKFDLIISDMGDNAEREKEIDFVDYAVAGIGMVIPKGNPQGVKTLSDFCGKTVSMEQGAIQVTFIKEFNASTCAASGKPITIEQFPKSSDALLSLRTGKSAGFFVDLASGVHIARNSDGGNAFEVLDDPSAPPNGYNPIKIGIGIGKEDQALRDAIKSALDGFVQDGTYAAIFKKYGLEKSAIKAIEINGAKSPL
ncbi:ABC transporter substrate-binding protein [Nonomuraea sp. LPB2021202275-12-8]|uniref:ABC transporter substrate-binding protein n=1 Tax=Nonomuraea sp. LPB2021202275-12-8 TaxID=3120159 RepID=UPI00300C7229